MKRKYWLLAAPLVMGAGPPVDAETRKDLRCFLAVSSLADNPDPTIKMSGMIGAQYFLGRIDGRVPSLDLERALVAEAAVITNADLPPLLGACGQQIADRGEVLTVIGKRMQNRAATASPSS
jgi:hypothetical protein